jgi:ABC-type multidrug transport system fused ATPase/permease subunit
MSERTPIEIDIKITEEVFWRVSFASRIKRFLLVTSIYLPIAILIMYFAVFGAGANPFSEKNWSILIVLFIICAIPFVFLAASYFSLRKLARKLAKATEETHFTFSENEVEINSSSRSTKTSWKNYEKIQETKEDFVCYLNNYTFHPIPKNSFKNEQQLNEFRELVREKLGGKAKLKQ